MRADRLLSLMLLLHARGRMTAADLSQQLEVSERTIYRDIEALSIAGVPIYTQTGINGGVFLDEDYRISLTGLSSEQVFSLFASPEAGPLKDLGLERAAEDSLLKLFAALPQPQRHDLEAMQARLYIDPHGWFHDDSTAPSILPILQQAVWQDRRVEVAYEAVGADVKIRLLDAYALVSKADVWYLVGRNERGEVRSYRLSRIKSARVLEDNFERDPDFDLAQFWQQARAHFRQQMEKSFGRYEATLRVQPKMWWYFGSFLEGRHERLGVADQKGWIPVKMITGGIDEAAMHTLSLGHFVWVDDPIELRDRVQQQAQSIVAHIENFEA